MLYSLWHTAHWDTVGSWAAGVVTVGLGLSVSKFTNGRSAGQVSFARLTSFNLLMKGGSTGSSDGGGGGGGAGGGGSPKLAACAPDGQNSSLNHGGGGGDDRPSR